MVSAGQSPQRRKSAYLDFSSNHAIEIVEDQDGRSMPARFVEPVAQSPFEGGHAFIGVLGAVNVEGICSVCDSSANSYSSACNKRDLRVRTRGSRESSSVTDCTSAVLPAPLEPVTRTPGAADPETPAGVKAIAARDVLTWE